jgi:hypothetical protein
MGLCEQLIKSNIQSDCNNPIFGGYKNIGWIINKADVDSWAKSNDEGSLLVSNIKLKSGAQAYKIQSLGSQPTPTTQTFVKGNFYNTWNNVVTIALLDNSEAITREIIMPMASGAKFVVILEHERTENGTPQFEVFGLSKGLQLQDGTNREEYNADLKGGWNIPLEETESPVPAYYIEDRSVIEGLETPAV